MDKRKKSESKTRRNRNGSAEGSEKVKPNPLELSLELSVELKKKEERKRLIEENPGLLQIASLCFKDFELNTTDTQDKPYIHCKHDIQIKDLVRVVKKEWKLRSPRIVLLVISNISSLHNWSNQKQIQSFKKGLIKAAEDTRMWIISNACDVGSTNMIGDAIRQHLTEAKYKSSADIAKILSNLTFIGIADEDMVQYSHRITSSDELVIEVPNEGQSSGDGKHVLNPNLTHYLLIKDNTINKNGVIAFLNNFVSFLSNGYKSAEHMSEDLMSIETTEVPVVSIVIKGGFDSSRLVLKQVRNRLPVVVLRGSGGLADLLAFCELELKERGFRNIWDPEFIESYLKPELTIRIMTTHPNFRDNPFLCSQFRNRILETVRESRKEGQKYLNVINLFDSYSTILENLTEYLLLALFQSQRTELLDPITTSSPVVQSDQSPKVNDEMIRRDLNLCVDWNCPDMAKKEVLSKDPNYSLNNEKRLFEDSLIRANRLEFVDLFLNQKFKLRAFVSPKRLTRMFRRIHLRPFFAGVCWEGILGRSREVKQSNKFLSRELNWLVEACTGFSTFFDEEELNLFVTRQYPFTDKEAERKALEMIVFWAILDFKKELVRLLWSHSEQPIHLALVIGMCYDRLSWYVLEPGLCEELKTEMKLFVGFALKVLDKCDKDSALRADRVLNEVTKDWTYKTPVDLAAIAKLRQFFDHPSCQRYLTNKFYGNISIRDLRYTSIRLPALIKLLLSAYLIFPAYFWIRLPNYSSNTMNEDEAEDEDDESDLKLKSRKSVKISEKLKFNRVVESSSGIENQDSSPDSSSSSDEQKASTDQDPNEEQKKPNLRRTLRPSSVLQLSAISGGVDRLLHLKGTPPPWLLVAETWDAPVTKFWNHQLFFTFYLSTFSIALLYPKCGNFWLDLVIAVWTALLLLDDIRQTYLLAIRNTNMSFITRVIDSILVLMFLLIYSSGRLLFDGQLALMNPYDEKIVMCLALLHAYYVFFTVFLPISATLGPLLYRLKIMVLVDFLNFIRLSILVMISFGVVLQAVLFPDYDMNIELFRKTFHRAFFSLFTTPSAELEADPNCTTKFRFDNESEDCSVSPFTDMECRVTGFWPYFFEIFYFILLKLILSTLLFAMFATSAQTLTADTDTIWRFQRYRLVMDFVSRGPVPPPLNFFYYIYLLGKWIITDFGYKLAKDPKKFREFFQIGATFQNQLLEDYDYTYLKLVASQTYNEYRSLQSPDQLAAQQWERIKAIGDELEYEGRTLRQIKGKLSEMERSSRQTLVYLETIKHLTTKHTAIEDIGRRFLHVLSRRSPYPNTIVQRFPVPDKYVSWDVMWILYDPIAYSMAKSDFKIGLKEFCDPDLNELQLRQLEQPNQSLPVLEWNRPTTTASSIKIDRTSWQMTETDPLVYKLANDIPVNPFGRTGLRGKGALPRWGPNHYVMVVVTRKISNSLEVLIEKINTKTNAISLIVRFIPGDCTYIQIEKLFKTTDSEHKNWTESEKMINYFKEFAQTIDETSAGTDGSKESSLKCEQLVRGYFDDPLNTDQAWKEIELWHLHYTQHKPELNDSITENLEWREVTESFFTVLSLSQSNIIQIIVDKLKVRI